MSPSTRRTNRFVQVVQEGESPLIVSHRYTLAVIPGRPFVALREASGTPLAELFVLSGINTLHGRDDTTAIGQWEIEEEADGTVLLSLEARSAIWQAKRFRFRCEPDRLRYEVEVEGHGTLAESTFFGGYYSGNLRWGSGFFLSKPLFRRGFNPEPSGDTAPTFFPAESSSIDLTGVPLPGRSDWFFTPPPFCFSLQGKEEWVGVGLAARPGENRWSAYRYQGQQGGFWLAIDYEGYTAVDGRYRLPAVTFDFASDEYAALEAHVQTLRAAGDAPPRDLHTVPAWWHEPIFCGWGSQCHLAGDGIPPQAYARQSDYEQFLETLAEQDITPGIVVLDDKWQATYGENEVDRDKWPDLRGFVKKQHANGRRVLLWLKAWDPEGLPVEECITNAAGLPLSIDPTHPGAERRLRASVRRMLSPDGYDADGFKLDFTARIPSGPGMKLYGDQWGLELMHCYLSILYDEAKRVKPDSLLMTHTPHPYLADVLDMIRLNDMIHGRDVAVEMRHRARIAAIACPDALIDTDNWPVADRATWRAYLPLQSELGVPSLYYASHVDGSGEPLEAEDYRAIREVWNAVRQNGSANDVICLSHDASPRNGQVRGKNGHSAHTS